MEQIHNMQNDIPQANHNFSENATTVVINNEMNESFNINNSDIVSSISNALLRVACDEIRCFIKDIAPLDECECFIFDLPNGISLPIKFHTNLKEQFSKFFLRERKKSSNGRFLLPCIIDEGCSECIAFGWPSDWEVNIPGRVAREQLVCANLEFLYRNVKNPEEKFNKIQRCLFRQQLERHLYFGCYAVSAVAQEDHSQLSCINKEHIGNGCARSYPSSFSDRATVLCTSSPLFLTSSCARNKLNATESPDSSFFSTSWNSSSSYGSCSPYCSISPVTPFFCLSPQSSCIPFEVSIGESSVTRDEIRGYGAIHYGSYSSSGVRPYNEDRVIMLPDLVLECNLALKSSKASSEITSLSSYQLTSDSNSYSSSVNFIVSSHPATSVSLVSDDLGPSTSLNDSLCCSTNTTSYIFSSSYSFVSSRSYITPTFEAPILVCPNYLSKNKNCIFQSNNNQAMYFAVYDGHNGEEAVEYVRKYLHRNIYQSLCMNADGRKFTDYITESICSAFEAMDESLHDIIFAKHATTDDQHIDYLQFTSGCTACVCFLSGRYLIVANLGDSRVVISRAGMGIALNKEHRINSNESEQIRVLNAGGIFDCDGYISGSLGVSRAFGDFDKVSKEKIIGLSNHPEVHFEELRNEDEFMIIACDGIYDVMSTQDTVTLVRNYLTSNNDSNEAAKYLCNIALAKKSLDNVSAVIVVFQNPQKHDITMAETITSCNNDLKIPANNPENKSHRRIKFLLLSICTNGDKWLHSLYLLYGYLPF